MKLKFLGVGGAFAPIAKGNSNMMLTSDSGKVMMIDWGTTAPYIFRDELARDFREIDALWISHLHADHIGGLEMLAFARYFQPKLDKDGKTIKIKLFMVPELMRELWETSLKGGLESVEQKVMNLTDYFECIPVPVNSFFVWEGYVFQPVQTIHVMSGYQFKHSYGLMCQNQVAPNTGIVGNHGGVTFITTDTQFAPEQLQFFYKVADWIFHDCETLPFKSHVHAHYNDLNTLPPEVKAKMWLYHYADKRDAAADGFAGFVDKGQEFTI